MQILNYEENNYGYIESKSLDIRYYCLENAMHYDTMLYLVSLFFGVDDLIKDKYTVEEIADFIKKDIIIVAKDTDSELYKEKLINDFTRFSFTNSAKFRRIKSEFY